MTPVFQSIYDKNRGDCLRASLASLFDLELIQVPHFGLYSDDTWHHVYNAFIWGLGYEWLGTGYPEKKKISDWPTVGGYVEACVKSKNFKDRNHSVIMDTTGLIIHDPNKDQKWHGINVLESGDLKHWSLIKKQNQMG